MADPIQVGVGVSSQAQCFKSPAPTFSFKEKEIAEAEKEIKVKEKKPTITVNIFRTTQPKIQLAAAIAAKLEKQGFVQGNIQIKQRVIDHAITMWLNNIQNQLETKISTEKK